MKFGKWTYFVPRIIAIENGSVRNNFFDDFEKPLYV